MSPRLDLRSDAADQVTAATSAVHDGPLLTRDRFLLRARRVPLALRATAKPRAS